MGAEINFQFKEFKPYAGFLLADRNLQQELAESYLAQVRGSHLPSMQFLLKLPSQQSLLLIQNFFQDFLKGSLNDTAFASAVAELNKWRTGNFSGSYRKEKEIYDLIRGYGIQNQLLIHYLSRFTQELLTFSSIVQELEYFQNLIEEVYDTVVSHKADNVLNSLTAESLENSMEKSGMETFQEGKEGQEKKDKGFEPEARPGPAVKKEDKETALLDLERKNLNLQRVNNYLENFVFVASHDLRTPVSNLEHLLQILRESFMVKADVEETQILKMTELATGRLKKIINDLLEVVKTKGESGEAGVEEGKVRFQEVVQEVKGDNHLLIVENQALITEEFGVEEIVYPRANLRSIIYNLLSNAVKYRSTERPLVVELTTCIKDHYVVLSVKDNGLGLGIDQLKNLFSMFNRMHQQTEGIGIGLYSVKRMVETSGGKIDVKSEKGKGSEFLVYFPL